MKESYLMANANVLFYNETLQTDAFTERLLFVCSQGTINVAPGWSVAGGIDLFLREQFKVNEMNIKI